MRMAAAAHTVGAKNRMSRASVSQTETVEVAADAFVFGYPLVLGDRMRIWMTDAARPDPVRMRAPPNQFVHAREVPGATADGLVAPHADTLRSSAWLDLGDGPVVLNVPDTYGRFYALSMIDLWSNVFASVGARTTGCSRGAFGFVGPRGSGAGLPADVLPVAAPTRMVRIAGLTKVDGDGRFEEAHAVQDGLRLARLGPEPAPAAAGPERRRGRTPPVGEVERMDAATFFQELTRLMHDNPPRLQDRLMLERMRRVGLYGAGEDGWAALTPAARSAVERGAELGLARIVTAAEAPPGEPAGSWRIRFGLGDFGTDHLSRAAAACAGLETGPAADELPALVQVDADGRALYGRHRYELRFPPGGEPPVFAFWTLTTYDDRQPLVDNPTDRYSIGDWNGLTLDPDGSMPIAIQHRPPDADGHRNWLPAPPGRFNVLLRLIWPMPEVLDRRWAPPAVHRIG